MMPMTGGDELRNKSSEAATAAFTATAGLRGDGRRAPSAVRVTAA